MVREAKTAVVGTEACRRWVPCLMPSTLPFEEATRNDFYLPSRSPLHHVSDHSFVPFLFFPLYLRPVRCTYALVVASTYTPLP
jgi:hypothetical protein